ncbi:hypothetical protein AGMMS50267_00030 [Spirochaetia bacterium]|nr:hypothetical protein AGMMS50267_00030 [Spirochaetia bacterium]
MKKMYGIAAIVMAFALLFTACTTPEDDPEAESGTPVTRVTVSAPGSGAVNAAVPELIYVGTPVTYLATVVPANAGDITVTWASANTAIATVADGVVSGVAEGTTAITVTTNGKKADGNPATSTFNVKIEIDPNNIPADLRIFNMANAVEGSTAPKATVSASDFNADGRLVISNKTTTSGWGTTTQQVNGNTFVYLTKPLLPPFTISARVKITSLTAAAGTDNGFFVGAFSDPTVDTQVTPAVTANIIHLAGINTSTNGRRSVYATRGTSTGTADNTATGSTQFTDRTDKEYQFIVSRTDAVYNMNVKDDALAGDPSHAPYPADGAGINRGANSSPTTEIHEELAGDKPLFLGIMISGVDVEISSIVIKQGDDVVYQSPTATATPIPVPQSVTITNAVTANTVNAGASLGMAATVTPADAIQDVTWSIEPANAAVATINADTGAVTGVGVGTVTVYATSVADATKKSTGFVVTVTNVAEVIPNNRSWNFQTLPAGWTDNIDNAQEYNYGQGMTLTGADFRTPGIRIQVGQAAPADSGFSVGALKPNGAPTTGLPAIFARIDEVQGPFTLTLNYGSNNTASRYPSIKIKTSTDADYGAWIDGPASAGANDAASAKMLTYTYTGTDKVTIALGSSGGHPGNIHDVIIAYTGTP